MLIGFKPVFDRVAKAFCLAAIVVGALGLGSAVATAAEEDTDPVFVFNRICYAQVPDTDKLKTMAAKLAWRALEEEDLKQFKSYDDPKVLDGWDAQIGERFFRVGIIQAGLTDKMKKSFPDFVNGTATSCSIVLDEQQKAAVFVSNMKTLAGKEPITSDVPEGEFLTKTWAGGNADLKVFLFAKSPPSGMGGLLNVTVIQK